MPGKTQDTESPSPAEYYNAMGDRYISSVDSKPYNALYERPATLSLLPRLVGLRILDAGCGSGWYASYFLENGAASVTCFDASHKMVEAASARLGTKAKVLLHDLNEPLDFASDASYDLIVAPLVMHYLPDLKSPFEEFQRVLKPGGNLVFSVHHPSLVFQEHNLPDYYQVTRIEEEWSVGKVSFYHHPLNAYTMGLADAGFIIERLVEARPGEEFKKADPHGYEKVIRNPWFLFFRARLDS